MTPALEGLAAVLAGVDPEGLDGLANAAEEALAGLDAPPPEAPSAEDLDRRLRAAQRLLGRVRARLKRRPAGVFFAEMINTDLTAIEAALGAWLRLLAA